MAQPSSDDASPRKTGKILRGLLMGASALGFLGLMAGGTALLHIRANAEIPVAANPPVTVSVATLQMDESYTITEHFVGRLEAARETRLAFERGGLVREILVEEGGQIQKGDVIARLDTAKLEAERETLKAERTVLEARQRLSQATLKRQKKLASKGWKSAQTFDEARFGLQEVEAGITRVDASIAALNVDIAKSVLRAPFSGTIANRVLDEGSIVSAGAVVADLLESGKRQVRIGVSPDVAQSLKPGDTHKFRISGQDFTGKVAVARPDLETRTRTVSVLFDVEGAQQVPFGEIAELIVERKVEAKGTWLPLSALTEGRKGLWSVLTVVDGQDGPEISREAAEVLHVSGDRVFVRGTFQTGARLLTEGVNRVTPGQRVSLAVAG